MPLIFYVDLDHHPHKIQCSPSPTAISLQQQTMDFTKYGPESRPTLTLHYDSEITIDVSHGTQAHKGTVSPHMGGHLEEQTQYLEGQHRAKHHQFPHQTTPKRTL